MFLVLFRCKDTSGVLAVDLMKDSPYYKKAWALTDDGMKVSSSSYVKKDPPTKGCITIPEPDPEYAAFPPSEFS